MSDPTTPTTIVVPGWQPPAWSTKPPEQEGSLVRWYRAMPDVCTYIDPSTDQGLPGGPELSRADTIRVDGAAITMVTGMPRIWVTDDTYVTPADARKLAAALVELADAADGVQ